MKEKMDSAVAWVKNPEAGYKIKSYSLQRLDGIRVEVEFDYICDTYDVLTVDTETHENDMRFHKEHSSRSFEPGQEQRILEMVEHINHFTNNQVAA